MKFFPLIAFIPYFILTPVLYLLVSLYAMVFPPLDVAVYKRAADFIFSGMSPYSSEFITGDVFLPWVYTPFGTLVLLPLHFIPESMLLIFWSIFGILIPLTLLVAVGYQGLFSRLDFSKKEKFALVFLLTFLATSTGPIIDAWAIGQIGVLLAAFTLFDLAAPDKWFFLKSIRIPRGILAGLAGAIKLVPLIVVPYWVVTKQWKPAVTASITLFFAWFFAFLVMPSDSLLYVKEKLFLGTRELENAATLDNQSLIGTLMRMTNQNPLPSPLFWFTFATVLTIGLLLARKTFFNNDFLSAGIIVGLTSVLVSPISWIHHIAWLVAVPGAILANSEIRDDLGQITKTGWLWFATLFVVAIPPVRYGWSPVRWIGLEEHYSFVCVLIIVILWWRSHLKEQLRQNQAKF